MDFSALATSLSNTLGAHLPNILGALAILIIGWIIAVAARAGSLHLLEMLKVNQRIQESTDQTPDVESGIAGGVFWVILLVTVLGVLPNVFAALVIGFVGWLVAKVLRGLVVNLLAAAGADEAGHKAGLEQSVQISRVVGTLVFIFIFIPTLIAALDALQIETVSRPATDMLGRILDAVPQLVAAGLILVVTWYVAKFASSLIARLLNSMGLDTLPEKIGLGGAFGGELKPSTLIGMLIMFFAMLFATVEAANQLQFSQVRDVVTTFINFGGDILLGAVILLIGFWLANLAYTAITRAGGDASSTLARVARIAILGLVIAMGLRAMGIADDIVNLAFALTFGAVAVAVALSFGLGGREAAGKQMEHWLSKLRK